MRTTLSTVLVFLFLAPPIAHGDPVPAAPADAVFEDWLKQDTGGEGKKCFVATNGCDREQKLVLGVVEELDGGDRFVAEAKALSAGKKPGSDAAWKDLYIRACAARRRQRLSRLRARCGKIVYTRHYNLGGSHYAYTEGQSDAQAERHFIPGASLCLMDVSEEPTSLTLLADEKGVIRDPAVSWNGDKILFSWKKSNREDDYHLYEMDAASRDIRQLTWGRGFCDYEGAYLPNGDIIFNSTRCVQTVDCWWTEVSNLYVCDGDGKHLRRVSFDQVHTNYPQVLDDGRVVYTRWDYNDRGQIYPQPLFQMNSDGTAQTEYYGNNSWFPTTIGHARGIPGTGKIMAVLFGHHCHQKGKLAIVDPSRGRQEAAGVTMLAPEREAKAVRVDAYGQKGEQFQYPYPFNEEEFLVTYAPDGVKRRDARSPFGTFFMFADGRRELLAFDPQISCNQPVPLAPRKRPTVRPPAVDWTKETGTYYVQNVYIGPGLAGVEKGAVKSIRVVALEFRPAGVGANRNRGPAGGAMVSTPISVGNGSWDVKKVVGSATVYPDGSAFFAAPVRTPLYFQCLDENNRMIQTMRTWSTLQPGENFACVGCHEDKNQVSLQRDKTTMALKAGPRELEPFYGPVRGFSFPKEIQPILDRHCVKCHNDRSKKRGNAAKKRKQKGLKVDPAKADPLVKAGKTWKYKTKNPGSNGKEATVAKERAETAKDPGIKKAFSLLGTSKPDKRAKRAWSDAYLALTNGGRSTDLVNWVSVQSVPSLLKPYHAGAATSGLFEHLADHHGVELSREERDKLACWIDLAVPCCGDYAEANTWNEKDRNKYYHFLHKRMGMAALERANIAEMLTGNRPAGAPDPRMGVDEAVAAGAAVAAARGGGETTAPARFADNGDGYRNLALNPADRMGDVTCYPHASTNSVCRNNPAFAACNVIDGKTANTGHGKQFPSWGPDKREDLWLKIDFGREVAVDKIVLWMRADFPHDACWHAAVVEFSDGGSGKISIAKTAAPRTFDLETPRRISWLRFRDLEQKKPLGWAGFSEVKVWGRDVEK